MDEHFSDSATLLAALHREDGQRQIAEEHVSTCPRCREALEEGSALLALLRRAMRAETPVLAVEQTVFGLTRKWCPKKYRQTRPR
jgi:hypothetical protein